MIGLIDFGAGNLHSVAKALRYLGADLKLFDRPEGLLDADAAVLPGVGAFDDCMNALRAQELQEATVQFIQSGRPFLGICVGYQALFDESEEFNSCAQGLRIFSGKVVRFPAGRAKVPQIGWNQVKLRQTACPLFKDIADGTYFYFVHSFYPRPDDQEIIATTTEYGGEDFASSVWRGNVFATQFHPEKSQKAGLQLLENFLALAKEKT